MRSRPTAIMSVVFVVIVVVLVIIASCAASMEQRAREELEERGFRGLTIHPLKRGNNAFSFEGTNEGEPCEGEIELQQEMGQTVATVSSHCGADE